MKCVTGNGLEETENRVRTKESGNRELDNEPFLDDEPFLSIKKIFDQNSVLTPNNLETKMS